MAVTIMVQVPEEKLVIVLHDPILKEKFVKKIEV
jgi:hypothetical protein